MPVKLCFMHTISEKMSKLAKNNAKCEIFARYAEINSTDSIDKQSILSLFHNTCKNKIIMRFFGAKYTLFHQAASVIKIDGSIKV